MADMLAAGKKAGDAQSQAIYSKGKQFYTGRDRAFLACANVFLVLFGLMVLYPLIYIVSMSFSSVRAVLERRVWLWPVDVTLDGYKGVFQNSFIVSGYLNSIVYLVGSVVVNVFMTMICAYPLSLRQFRARGVFMLLLTITMFFSGGLIPSYILISKLKLLDNRLVMILPGAMSVWNVIMARTFIRSNIADGLREAAQLDGCGDIRFLWSIVVPLSQAIIAVVALYTAVGSWNGYFGAMIYLTTRSKFPLQLILREILILNTMSAEMTGIAMDATEMTERIALRELLKYSLIIVASAPLIIMYPFVQKHFVKGVMVGSLKG